MEKHFLLKCPQFDKERKRIVQEQKKRLWNDDEMICELMGGCAQNLLISYLQMTVPKRKRYMYLKRLCRK